MFTLCCITVIGVLAGKTIETQRKNVYFAVFPRFASLATGLLDGIGIPSNGTIFTSAVPGCILIQSWVAIQTIDRTIFIHVPTCVAVDAENNAGQMLVLSFEALFASRVTAVVLVSSWYAWQTIGRTFVLRVLTCITFETRNIARQMLVFSFVTLFTLERTIGVLISSRYARQTVWQTILCLVLSFHTLRTGIGVY